MESVTEAALQELSVRPLMSRSREITGIDRIDADAIEPLEVLCASLREDAGLHDVGVANWKTMLLRILSNRLRMQRDFAAHPEIADERIAAPVICIGMPRTGSTKIQKLLANSGDFNWLPLWKAYNPSSRTGIPGESPEPRIEDTDAFVDCMNRYSPELRSGHDFSTHEPEEESCILEHSLRTPCFLGWGLITGYLKWLSTQSMTAQFEHLRDTLKYLQWQGLASPSRRWLLKSPLYYGMEPSLLEVFPDACLIMSHRHPKVSVPSSIKLLEKFFKPYSNARPDADRAVLGSASSIRRHFRNRERMRLDILDISYPELVRSPEAVIERVYRFCRIPLSDGSRARMLAWNGSNPKDKHGRHAYSLAEYGYSEERIQEVFAEYIDFLGKLEK
ncbi:MAG: Sulfotransferase family [Proteobacteria bacterium]|nr:Sulfotransferase family [Pseudomonadota bacterium]